MEYVSSSDRDRDVAYMMLVEKGYYQPLAFRCLGRLKEDFEKFFNQNQIQHATDSSLSREFEGSFERIGVRFGNLGRV